MSEPSGEQIYRNDQIWNRIFNWASRFIRVSLVDINGNPVSSSSPVPVQEAYPIGVPDYHVGNPDTGVSVNHDLTPEADVRIPRVLISAGDSSRFELQLKESPSDPFETLAVKFITEQRNNEEFVFDQPLLLTSTQTLRVVKLNRSESGPINLYSTIITFNA